MKRDFLTLKDFSGKEILELLDLAQKLKQQKNGLKGKTLAMIFEKPSCRTRVSFDVAMYQLGGYALTLSPEEIQLGVREPIKDVARTLSRYVDGIMIRTFSQETLNEMARFASVPVINGLSDLYHPCQALADILTIDIKKKVTYLGDGNNVCHSLLWAAAKLKIDLTVATPKGYEPNAKVVEEVFASGKGLKIKILNDPIAAVSGAHYIYTDVWTSMGQEKEKRKRIKDFSGFQLNSKLLSLATKQVKVLHCLPAHRGEEITDEVVESKNAIVFDQAENRMHAEKAILYKLLK